jgi:hypothetical protein
VVSQIVTYEVDDSTLVKFEIDAPPNFNPASPGQAIGRVKDAVTPAVEAAKAVLDKVKEAQPDHVELKFGMKVSGGASWFVARAASEANFEITLTWNRGAGEAGSGGDEHP